MPVVAIGGVVTGAFALRVYDEVVNQSSSLQIGACMVCEGWEDISKGVC